MSIRPLAGSSWAGSGVAAVVPPTPPPPDPDPPPDTPPPTEPSEDGLVDRLDGRTLAIWHHGAEDGATVTDLVGELDGAVTTGTVVALQPALTVDDEYNSMLYTGDAYATVPANAALAASGGGVLAVFQMQPGSTWMTLVNRFGDSWANPGGFAIAVVPVEGTYRVRAQLNNGTENVVLQPTDVEVEPGVAYGVALTWGAAGLKLYLGNADSAAEIETDTDTAGAQGSYPINIGADRAGSARFFGAIDIVALYDGQPSGASVLLDLAEVKDAGVVWANDGSVTVQADETVVFDPRPRALVDSTSPTAVVTVQPSNATATAETDGTITIEAGSTPGASTNGRYTLDGSPAAMLSVSVTAVDVTPAQLFLNPYNDESAHHRRIGGDAEYAAAISSQSGYEGDNVFVEWSTQGVGAINGANGNVYGCDFEISEDADPERTITHNGSGAGTGLPFTAKMPNTFPFYESAIGEATNLLVDYTVNDIYAHFRESDGTDREAFLRRSHDIRGAGHSATFADTTRYGSSASGCSTVLGLMRKFEIETPGLVIGHAHQIILPRGASGHINPQGLSKRVVKPARYVDGTAHNVGENLGPIDYGDLVAIPPDDLAGVIAAIEAIPGSAFSGSSFGNISSAEGAAKEAMIRFATACCHHGCYAIDGGNVPQFRADRPFAGWLAQAMMVIMRRPFWWAAFKVVTNSTTGANVGVNTSGSLINVNSGTPSGAGWSGGNATNASIGTFVGGDIAGGGAPLATNTAIV